MGLDFKEKDENGYTEAEEDPPKQDLSNEEAQQKKVKYPKSVFFIISNEFCERFSYYGMRTVLSLYIRDILSFSESDSTIVYHVFNMMAYFFPILGAILSDSWLGKFRTILYVSIIYACGNILLALTSVTSLNIPQAAFSFVALLLIAIGTGGIKPCVSSFGGDQFVLPQQEQHLVTFFSVFYFTINAGSLISTFLTPVLREDVKCFDENTCYPLAFAVPGVLMIVSIIIFFLGMPLYKIRKPEGNIIVKVIKCMWYGLKQRRQASVKQDHWLDHAHPKYERSLIEEIKICLKVLVVFTPLPIFWTLYDQQGSAWTFQATRMDGRMGSWTLLPDQMQVVNPLLILLFIPLFTYVIYPFFAKFKLIDTPLKRMVVGGFIAAIAFGISAGVSAAVEASDPVLPENGLCQLRIYNPQDSPATFTIENGLVNVDLKAMSYVAKDMECSGTKNYSYTFGSNSGELTLKEATGYFIFPTTSDVVCAEDDISKPSDGIPKIRTLIGNPSDSINFKYTDGDDIVLESTSGNYSLFDLDPGTYSFGSESYEVDLGGVYTVIAQLEGDTIKSSKFFEITQHNTVHMMIQMPQQIIITVAEILFSITGLEFAYSQAPVSMKSFITGCFLLTSFFGNLLIVIIESVGLFDRQSLDFTLYTCLMIADMILFTFIASRYTYPKKSYEDDDENKKDDKAISVIGDETGKEES